MSEQEERARVVAAAHSWLRTPYHHEGRVKGAGVDCLTLLAGVFEETRLIPKIIIPHYPKDWHLHRDAERYLDGLLQYTREVTEPQPGDIALWRFGRCYSHGGIVVKWPVIIHAYISRSVMLEDAESAAWLNYIGENGEDSGKIRPRRFFSFWGR